VPRQAQPRCTTRREHTATHAWSGTLRPDAV